MILMSEMSGTERIMPTTPHSTPQKASAIRMMMGCNSRCSPNS